MHRRGAGVAAIKQKNLAQVRVSKRYRDSVILNTSDDAGDTGDAGETRLMLWRRPNHLRSLPLRELRSLLIADAASRQTCLSDLTGTSQLVTRSTRHTIKSCDELIVVFHGDVTR